jgi:hypothetical protein
MWYSRLLGVRNRLSYSTGAVNTRVKLNKRIEAMGIRISFAWLRAKAALPMSTYMRKFSSSRHRSRPGFRVGGGHSQRTTVRPRYLASLVDQEKIEGQPVRSPNYLGFVRLDRC